MRVIWSVVGAYTGDDEIPAAATAAIKAGQYLVKDSKLGAYPQKVEIGSDDFGSQPGYIFMAKNISTLQVGLKHFIEKSHDVLFYAHPQVALSYGSYKQEIEGRTAIGLYLNGLHMKAKGRRQLVGHFKKDAATGNKRNRSGARAPARQDLSNLIVPTPKISNAIAEAAHIKATTISDKLANEGVYVKVGTATKGSVTASQSYEALIPAMVLLGQVAVWLGVKHMMKGASGTSDGELYEGNALKQFMSDLNK